MIKQLKYPTLVLLGVNLLVGLPLILLGKTEAASFNGILTILQTIVWLIIIQILGIGAKLKVNAASLAFGGLISLKFFFSLSIFLFMFQLGYFHSKLHIGLFLLSYVIYTPCIYTHGNRLIKENDVVA